jgi:uncharacterized protein YcgI (DUF1989 family)
MPPWREAIGGYVRPVGGGVSETFQVPGGEGRAALVRSGEQFLVVDAEGGQVGDLFAFAADDLHEFASAEHTRMAIAKLFPRPGDPVMTNRRRPILYVTGDTSPGRHDMLYAACDPARYASLGAGPGHRSCVANLREALRAHGHEVPAVPQPLNVFMDVRVQPDGTLVSHPASSRPGDYIAFRAARDCLVALSSCPMDVVPISSGGITPLELRVHEATPSG